jgi:cytochrome c biogenesis protein
MAYREEQVKKEKNREGKEQKERGNFLSSLINFFSSLRLTIFLLILLAALSVIGTLIPQHATEQEYLRLYSTETYYLFKGLGLFNMYHSWWFIGVLILLAINLIACSLKRLPGVWHQVRKTKSGYARLGTYLTHLGVLLILAGGLIGAVWGFEGYVEIREGETVTVALSPTLHEKRNPGGIAVRCDSFRVDFYPNGSPKEYVSTLTFQEGERTVLDHVPLRVNHPLFYSGLTFYQSSYGISMRSILEVRKKGGKGMPPAIELNEGEVEPIPGTQARIGLMQYQENAHGMGEAILLVLVTPHASPEGFWLFMPHPVQVGDFTFSLKGLERKYYTELKVTRNPGLPIVWVGCSLLVIGMVVTFTLRRAPKSQPLKEQ